MNDSATNSFISRYAGNESASGFMPLAFFAVSSRVYAGNERVEQSCFRMEVILSRVHVGNKSVIAVIPSDFFRFISHVCGK
jgi:hypothetical protein